jgi:hypothetical protein
MRPARGWSSGDKLPYISEGVAGNYVQEARASEYQTQMSFPALQVEQMLLFMAPA